jgi:hypothetical protein
MYLPTAGTIGSLHWHLFCFSMYLLESLWIHTREKTFVLLRTKWDMEEGFQEV